MTNLGGGRGKGVFSALPAIPARPQTASKVTSERQPRCQVTHLRASPLPQFTCAMFSQTHAHMLGSHGPFLICPALLPPWACPNISGLFKCTFVFTAFTEIYFTYSIVHSFKCTGRWQLVHPSLPSNFKMLSSPLKETSNPLAVTLLPPPPTPSLGDQDSAVRLHGGSASARHRTQMTSDGTGSFVTAFFLRSPGSPCVRVYQHFLLFCSMYSSTV